ncbi:acyltransferase family protein [Vibrio ulleungensis]|uniref:Acyltransferase n=1 Tax=Vibrio ulleungensis TaxID=2807619 RepID=A0ABS2HN19_9VIBR|nr:acyltransferase family protein [Vibrio ulleungensis]MBM7037287.1 acyltransferase [Vibrio ulleungensis]
MDFRQDINGLRALAVVIVVIFHFFGSALPGGFVGVDVFFVISGYLMTGIIVSRLEEQRFHLLGFYGARAKRIIPALLALCLVLFIFGNAFFNPLDLQTLNKHISSSLLFFSNFVYLTESGYFNGASHSKWLLHTWSLSVEWQFYILYPIVLAILSRYVSIRAIKFIVLIFTPIAFAISMAITHFLPLESYFLFPSRAWQMMLGGVAFLFPLPTRISMFTRSVMEKAGVAAIVFACFILSKNEIWPNSFALVPVGGAYLVILANNSQSFVLNNKVSQALGLWSYSIYLWHWPIVVLGYFLESKLLAYLGIPLSLVLGFLSYSMIEKRNFSMGTLKYWPVSIVFLVGVSSSSAQFFYTERDIYTNYHKYESLLLGHYFLGTDGTLTYNQSFEKKVINQGKPYQFLMLGDSNSAHFAYGISLSEQVSITHKWIGSCPGFIDLNPKPHSAWMDKHWVTECRELHKLIQTEKNTPVILAQFWGRRDFECARNCEGFDSHQTYYSLLRQELGKLVEYIGDRPVFIVGQVPAPKRSMIKCLKKLDTSDCERSTSDFDGERIRDNTVLEKFASQHLNVTFINPFSAVCDALGECKTIIEDDNMFFDGGHLSAYGSHHFWQYIEAEILTSLSSSTGALTLSKAQP